MAIGIGNLVSHTDFNAIVAKIQKVLGDDGVDEQIGYGRAVLSSTVSTGDTITSDIMDNLYADLVKARTHQKGTNFTWDTPTDGINAPDAGEYIGAFAADIGTSGTSSDATADEAEGFLDFSQAAQDIVDDVYDVGADQTSIQVQDTAIRTEAWNGSIIHTVDIVWANADERRYFFNSGGLLIFNAGLSGGNSVAGDQTQTYPDTPAYQKDEIWQTMLNTMGTIYFGRNNTAPTGSGTGQAIGNYDLTSSYQTIFQKDGSGVYSENFYRIEAKDNSAGLTFGGESGGSGAENRITFRITFSDADVGDNRDADAGFPGEGTPVDENVTGTITSTVSTRAATGVLNISHPSSSQIAALGGAIPASYTLTAPSTQVTEGNSITVTLTTTNVASGTNIPYTISGISAADLSSGALTGNFTVDGSGVATRSIALADEGTTEGTETLTLSLNNGAASINIDVLDAGTPAPTYSITNPSTNVIAEGSTGTFTVTTTNVPNGTVLYWTISHLTTTDSDFTDVQGTVTINSNTGSIGIQPTADVTTEGQESFILRLRTGSYTGTIVASGGTGTTVGDTSTSPTPDLSALSSFSPDNVYLFGFAGPDPNRGAGAIIRFFNDGDIHVDKRSTFGIYNTQVQNTTPIGTWLPSGKTASDYEIRITIGSITEAAPSEPNNDLEVANSTSSTWTSFGTVASGSQGIEFYIPSTVSNSFANVNDLKFEIREKANTSVLSSHTYSNIIYSVEE